jgi:hypothetical protein
LRLDHGEATAELVRPIKGGGGGGGGVITSGGGREIDLTEAYEVKAAGGTHLLSLAPAT